VRTVLIGRDPRFTLVRIVLVVAVAIVLFKFILLPIRVDGPSMLPTYKHGAVNFVNRLAYWRSEPKRGDIVAVRYSGRSMMLMKRVVALPGETVEFINGQLFVNGQPMAEPYVKYDCDWTARREHYQLATDEYYVVGDNRSMPIDMHYQGAAQRKRILGRVLL
jgi:signal peptidase I